MIIRAAEVADASGIARVHVDTWRTAYVGIVSEEHLAKLSYEDSARRQRERISDVSGARFFFVAEDDDGQVMGFACGGLERGGDCSYKGEIGGIYLLQAYQRQGIGRRLVSTVARHLLEHNIDSMLIWVLADNASRGFYEALGGRPIKEGNIEIGGESLVEVAYGWKDIRGLAAMT